MSQKLKFDWDSIELSDAALDSIFHLTSQSDDVKQLNGDEEATNGTEDADKVELNNISEFLDWYSTLEDEPDDPSDLQCKRIHSSLRREQAKWQQVQQQVDNTLSCLDKLRNLYGEVSSKTNALHNDCEHLLDEQDQLLKRAEAIDSYLAYFNKYDRISAKLSSPYLEVSAESLVPILNEIDSCLEFVNQHSEFKESHNYQIKFKQVLARCLTLIHDSVFSVLENAAMSLESHIEQLSPENAFTIFYGRFRSHSGKVRPLMELLEDRLSASADYGSALNECITAYTQQRQRLLQPSVSAAVAEMANRFAKDYCSFVRTGCSFVLHLCEDEESLFRHFFRDLSPILTEMLRSLCTSLYDALRPCIVHIQHLETLCELCHILQHEAMASYGHRDNEPEAGAAFNWLCAAVLADTRERLVYRTYVYAKSEILGFKPAGGDVAYPEKLQMMQEIAESMKKDQLSIGQQVVDEKTKLALADAGLAAPSASASNGNGNSMPMSPADLHGMWFPTVRRTLTLLSKLNRCLDKATFQGLSQEILSMSAQSLLSAAQQISNRSSSSIDSDLFLMKHLLILREQVAPFQLEASVKETSLDFTKIRSAAVDLLSARSRLLALNRNNAFLQFLLTSHPDVIESSLDSRQQVDAELRSTCQRFIAAGIDRMAAKVIDFNAKCDSFFAINAAAASAAAAAAAAAAAELKKQPFAEPSKLHDLLAEAYKILKETAPALTQSLRLYLANRDTEMILFRPIKSGVQQAFRTTESIVQANFNEEELLIIACPSAEQINLLLNIDRDD